MQSTVHTKEYLPGTHLHLLKTLLRTKPLLHTVKEILCIKDMVTILRFSSSATSEPVFSRPAHNLVLINFIISQAVENIKSE
jgi:hypothetical protein